MGKKIHTGLSLGDIRRSINKESWEDTDYGMEKRSVFLGTVFNLMPSGKYYQPFASGNLEKCPVCMGSGEMRRKLKRRIEKKILNRNAKWRKLAVKRYGLAVGWPDRIRAESDWLNTLALRFHRACHRCSGFGSAEARDDFEWQRTAESELASVGLYLESGEGNPCDLFAVEVRDKKEEVSNELREAQ